MSVSNSERNTVSEETVIDVQIESEVMRQSQVHDSSSIEQKRVVYINQTSSVRQKYCSNSIRYTILRFSLKTKPWSNNIYFSSTSKYNLITFVPKFLFEQFCKYSNVFFLCIALIQVE